MIKDENAIQKLAKERAQRLRQVREYLRYTRAKFCEKYVAYGITPRTLESWELATWRGLTLDGAERLVKIFQDEEGIPVTIEWLLFGKGDSPITHKKKPEFDFFDKNDLPEYALIAQELQMFHRHNQNAVDTVVNDDGLAPLLIPGDYVAGIRYVDKDIEKAVGKICIVQLPAGNVLIRFVVAGKSNELFTISCLNQKTSALDPLLSDIELFSAAPILWVRKPKVNF